MQPTYSYNYLVREIPNSDLLDLGPMSVVVAKEQSRYSKEKFIDIMKIMAARIKQVAVQ